jgi:hypothetical protein
MTSSGSKIVDHLASLFSSPPVPKPHGAAASKHPLDPLTIEEVAAFTAAVKAHGEALGVGPLRFNFVTAKVERWGSWHDLLALNPLFKGVRGVSVRQGIGALLPGVRFPEQKGSSSYELISA